MGSLIDLSHTDNTEVAQPYSLAKLYESDQVFGPSCPSSHSQYSNRVSSSHASGEDAFSYRKIGPAIVLKSYQPKNSSLDSASSASSNLEDSAQSEDFYNYSLRAPFTYASDSIYAEYSLVDPNHYGLIDEEQMTLLQFDQDSLDTQAAQSYKTAATTTLAHADEIFQSGGFKASELTNQTQLIHQLDLLSADVVPVPASFHPQSQTDSPVFKLIPPLLLENPLDSGEPLLSDCTVEPSAPKELLASELDPSSCLFNFSTAPSDEASASPPSSEMQKPLLSLDQGKEAIEENFMEILAPVESHVNEKHAPLVFMSTDNLNEPLGDLDPSWTHVEEHKRLAANSSETSGNDSIRLIGTCPMNSLSEVASKSDDQVTIESTVIQTSRPTSTVNTSVSQLSPEQAADNSTLGKTYAPSVDCIPETPASDLPPVATSVKTSISHILSPEVTRQGDLATGADTDVASCNIIIHAGKPDEPIVHPEPISITSAPPVVQRPLSPACNVVEDNVATPPISTISEINPTSRGDDSQDTGKDINVVMANESSNDATEKAEVITSMSPKQASRMRSFSGFFKTLNKKQNFKTDTMNMNIPGSASVKSSEEEKSPQGMKELPKRKSLSSLKVKARFSSFYRSTDEPVPNIPKAHEPFRTGDQEKREVAVEGKTKPLKKCESRSPSAPKNREQPPQAARAKSQVISGAEVKVTKRAQQYKTSRAKRSLRSRSQAIVSSNTTPIDGNIEKPFASVVHGEIGNAAFPRPKTLRKKRTFNAQLPSPVLKDITLSGLLSRLMRKNGQKEI